MGKNREVSLEDKYVANGCPYCGSGFLFHVRDESRMLGFNVFRCIICARRFDSRNAILY